MAPREQAQRARPLHVSILRLATLLVAVTAFGIGLSTYLNTQRAVQALSENLVQQVSHETVTKTRAFLEQASPALQLCRALLTSDAKYGLSAEKTSGESVWRARGALLLRVLQANATFNQAHFGDESGDFVMAQRGGQDAIFVDHRWIEANGQHRHRVYRVGKRGAWVFDAARTAQGDSAIRSFDTRKRPWYTLAAPTDSVIWTPPYLFAEQQVSGVTAALRVTHAQQRVGVVGIGFELSDLDAFVSHLRVTEGSRVYILTETGEVVGHPDRASLGALTVAPSGRDLPLPQAKTSADPLLKAFSLHLADSAASRQSRAPITGLEFESGGVGYLGATERFPIGETMQWQALIAVPARAILGVVQQNSFITLGICGGVLLVSLVLGAALSIQISRPLRLFAGEMQRVGEFEISDAPLPASTIEEVAQMGQALDRMKASLRSFEKYVPSDVVRRLHRQQQIAQPGGQTVPITVFFADIIGFSRISERMTPDELVDALGNYLDVMESIIEQHMGILDKYVGDSVMAFWGAPIRPAEHPERRACLAALDYVTQFRRLREEREREGKTIFEAGIGIHTGNALVGNIGTARRLNYTAMGDTVNLTSRLEGVTRNYQTPILLSETTWGAVHTEFVTREIDTVAVKGRQEGITIYELLAKGDESNPILQRRCELYAAGLALYRARQWQEARARFAEIETFAPNDGAARAMRVRCETFLQASPPVDWNGIHVMTIK